MKILLFDVTFDWSAGEYGNSEVENIFISEIDDLMSESEIKDFIKKKRNI